MLKGLEGVGMVHRTGRSSIPQGYVQLDMVEMLVPLVELVRVVGERFKKCARCKVTYYCLVECQPEDWKGEHKALCKQGLTG